jgi:HEAT repeat protein
VRTSRFLLWMGMGLAVIGFDARLAVATDETGDELIQTIANLLSDNDKDMRALGLQQVREEVKGAAATKRFAAVLPKLAPEAQDGLLDALAERGDRAARPAVLEMLKSPEAAVRAAALRALGALGEPADVPLLAQSLAATDAEKAAARSGLVRLPGPSANAAILAESNRAGSEIRVELIALLAKRRATDTAAGILTAADDRDPSVRAAAMAALGQLGGPQHVAGMLKAVLKAEKGPQRDAAEKAVMFVCARSADANQRAEPVLAALAGLGASDNNALLPTLGRVGGPAALKVVEAALADANPQRQEAGLRALCNWPDSSVSARLLELSTSLRDPEQRLMAFRALIRVAALPDKRPDAQRLALLQQAMTLATRDEERSLILKRASAVRTVETLRFVVPYVEKPALAQMACETVVELAHHKDLRQPNKAEFDMALDKVIRTSKDRVIVHRAELYKQNLTWVEKQTGER